MKIAITGETGFLGYHLVQYFKYCTNYDVILLTRNYQSNISKLKECDWLIHCAGVNRGTNVDADNIHITTELIELLNIHDIKINISFISSVQEDLPNKYGISKLMCKNKLNDYCNAVGTTFVSHKLPNLFGPFGKPNYNSVVATFCYNIVNNVDCNVSGNTVSLCYVYDAISVIAGFKEDTYKLTSITVSQLYDLINEYHQDYTKAIIPSLTSEFALQLFNTYRSYANKSYTVPRYTDNRGYLVDLLRSKCAGSQLFFSTTKPGITRGNHFHFNKIERFCIIKGSANISLRKLGTEEVISYNIHEDDNTIVDIPVLYTHNITNVGDTELIGMFWTNEIYNQDSPDTYPEKV